MNSASIIVNNKCVLALSERGGSFRGRGGRNLHGGRNNSFGRGRGRYVFRNCNHCNMTNHLVETCWELYGKPS